MRHLILQSFVIISLLLTLVAAGSLFYIGDGATTEQSETAWQANQFVEPKASEVASDENALAVPIPDSAAVWLELSQVRLLDGEGSVKIDPSLDVELVDQSALFDDAACYGDATTSTVRPLGLPQELHMISMPASPWRKVVNWITSSMDQDYFVLIWAQSPSNSDYFLAPHDPKYASGLALSLEECHKETNLQLDSSAIHHIQASTTTEYDRFLQ